MKTSQIRMMLAAAILFAALRAAAGPVWVAHRGANREADENTLKAYRLAAGYGVDVIECDPRLTRDGIFVSMHDPTIDRTTGKWGEVAKMTLAELKSLRTLGGEEVPTLEEIFDLAKSSNLRVYLDSKRNDNDYLKLLTDFAAGQGMEQRVIVGVWNSAQLKWLKQNHPEMEACISWPWPPNTLARAKNMGASWVGTLPSLATREMINSAHKNGLKVITMPINDRKTIDKKIALGIDAVQTDAPRLKETH